MPKLSRVAVLWDPATPFHRAMLKEIDAADLGDALPEIARSRADALFVSQGLSPAARSQFVDFAAKHRLPSMFLNPELVAAGGLMSYAPDFSEMFRAAATYVDKILKRETGRASRRTAHEVRVDDQSQDREGFAGDDLAIRARPCRRADSVGLSAR